MLVTEKSPMIIIVQIEGKFVDSYCDTLRLVPHEKDESVIEIFSSF